MGTRKANSVRRAFANDTKIHVIYRPITKKKINTCVFTNLTLSSSAVFRDHKIVWRVAGHDRRRDTILQILFVLKWPKPCHPRAGWRPIRKLNEWRCANEKAKGRQHSSYGSISGRSIVKYLSQSHSRIPLSCAICVDFGYQSNACIYLNKFLTTRYLNYRVSDIFTSTCKKNHIYFKLSS